MFLIKSFRCLPVLLVFLGVAVPAAGQPATPNQGLPTPAEEEAGWTPRIEGRLTIGKDRRIRDPLGRDVLLRGVNAGSKSGDFLPAHTDADVASLVKATGINFVRLYISWRAVEPTPGTYDTDYLDGVVKHVERWNAHGVYVLVDMHQDLWGGPFTSNGAPDWATLGKAGARTAIPAGLPWQARYAEPAVWGSFEALWSNRRVPATGKGLQDHYAAAWAAVASRLKGRPGVVGYDLINEPFFGAEVARELKGIVVSALPAASRVGARATLRGAARGLIEFLTPRRPIPFVVPLPTRRVVSETKRGFRAGFERALHDPKVFNALLATLAKPTARFSRRLSRFYSRVGKAIEAIDPDALLFVEPMALAGIGVPSRMPRPALKNVVYAPHLYDAFVDSGGSWDGNIKRVEDALRNHKAEAKRMNAPLVIGEWGNAHRTHGRFLTAATRVLNRAGVSAAYWDHSPGEASSLPQAQDLALAVALGPAPRRVAGTLRTFSFRPGRFVVIYAPGPDDAPTVLTLPQRFFPHGVRVSTPTRVRANWRHDRIRGELLLRCAPNSPGVMIAVIEPAAETAPTRGLLGPR